MKPSPSFTRQRGFTLMETVIAIGVLSVLLTGFLIVFTPAAEGIKKSISVQEADRLTATVEHELTNNRTGTGTGFDKAFEWIKDSTGAIASTDAGNPDNALLVYQYRGNPAATLRADGSPPPVSATTGLKAGRDYTLVPMLRKKSDTLFSEDLPAIEGSVYLVKCVQLVHNNGELSLTTNRGSILNPRPNSVPPDPTYNAGPFANAAVYPEAVIAFAAEFYPCPSKAAGFFSGSAYTSFYSKAVKPTFTRNLAVLR